MVIHFAYIVLFGRISAENTSCSMVIKFSSNVVQPPVLLYMGVDKVENEELIKVSVLILKKKIYSIVIHNLFSTVSRRMFGFTLINFRLLTSIYGCLME